MIDITMTATLRPSLISTTLESFCRNMFKHRNDYRLIINIDAVGEAVRPQDVLYVCKSYFQNIVYNISNIPSFASAVIWCWKTAESDFIFHLEDDWVLVNKVSIDDMVKILKDDSSVACLRLSKYNIPVATTIKLWKSYYKYTGKNYFVTTDNNQFGLNPVLIKKQFVKGAVPILSSFSNPEKQFRPSKNEKMNRLINSWSYGLYATPGSRAVVLDSGTGWKEKHNFKKTDGSFLVWEKRR